ncbi:MAG TPA: sigma-54 dependent transcriptional regulator [Dissulfurispiraceae bacterium]
MQTILIVEDKKSMSDMLSMAIKSEGFAAKAAFTVKDGLASLAEGDTDAVITDLRLPDGSGMEILKAVKERFPLVPVIVMTAFGSIELAVRAVKEGAYEFITKPFDPDHLLLLLKRALDEKSVQKENILLKKEFSKFLKQPEIIGVSEPWKGVMEKVGKVAPLKTTALILGESGTGKELVAKAIHNASPRAKEPFVAVNCAAVPPDLIENELFGHEKGAFTGAHEIKPGRFELANRGTIFLDEIGDMAMPLQAKLLRVLQESEFERVGGARTLKVDVRVVAASNKDLESEVSAGRFREDLFYRLNVFPVVIPPLRERREDIIPVAEYFISSFAKEMSKQTPSITPEVKALLLKNDWKGNVRELRNVLERAVILCDGRALLPGHFHLERDAAKGQEQGRPDAPLHEVAQSAARSAEKERIESALKQTGGNKSRAAELLQVSYKTLLNKIKEYGIG